MSPQVADKLHSLDEGMSTQLAGKHHRLDKAMQGDVRLHRVVMEEEMMVQMGNRQQMLKLMQNKLDRKCLSLQ